MTKKMEKKERVRMQFVEIDALPEKVIDAILENERLDPNFVLDAQVRGLTRERWEQVVEIFYGIRGCDVLICLALGMKISGISEYLHLSERQVKDIAGSFITRLRIMHEAGQKPHKSNELEGFGVGLSLPAPRVRSKRGRPRKASVVSPEIQKGVQGDIWGGA